MFASVVALWLAHAASGVAQPSEPAPNVSPDARGNEAGAPSPADVPSRSRAAWLPAKLNADPNGSTYALEYRGAMRGRFSDSFAFYGGPGQPGYAIAITPFFELHEPQGSSNVLPSQYWRARLSLEQSYGFVTPVRRYRIGLLLQHESDHETAHKYSRPGFLALNDVTLRAQMSERHESWTFSAGLDAQVFVVSCTAPSRPCRNFRGDTSAGGQAQIAFGLPLLTLWRFVPFSAASASGILANGLVRAERRLSARLGFYTLFGESLFSFFALLWLGNDVGVDRHRSMRVAGAGVSFAR